MQISVYKNGGQVDTAHKESKALLPRGDKSCLSKQCEDKGWNMKMNQEEGLSSRKRTTGSQAHKTKNGTM